jgi:hypothetical protein
MMVRPRTEPCDAWQFASWDRGPTWVERNTEVREDGLYLLRRSGAQRVMPGEWIVRYLDNSTELMWLTDAEFKREYETLTQGEGR